MKKLGEFASIHIYFQLLYVHCYYRQTAMYIQNDRGSAEYRERPVPKGQQRAGTSVL